MIWQQETESPHQFLQYLERVFSPARLSYRQQPQDKREEEKPQSNQKIHNVVNFLLRRQTPTIPIHPFSIVDIPYPHPSFHEVKKSPPLPLPASTQEVSLRRQRTTLGIAAAVVGGLVGFEVASHTKHPVEGLVLGAAAGIFAASMFFRRSYPTSTLRLA